MPVIILSVPRTHRAYTQHSVHIYLVKIPIFNWSDFATQSPKRPSVGAYDLVYHHTYQPSLSNVQAINRSMRDLINLSTYQVSHNNPCAPALCLWPINLTASSSVLSSLFLSLSWRVSSWNQPPKPASLIQFLPLFLWNVLILSFLFSLLSSTLPCSLGYFLKFSKPLFLHLF